MEKPPFDKVLFKRITNERANCSLKSKNQKQKRSKKGKNQCIKEIQFVYALFS